MLNDKILRALGSQATEPATSFLIFGIGVTNTSRRRVLVVGAQIVVLDHLTVVALWFLPILLELIFHRYFLEPTDFLELWLHEVLSVRSTHVYYTLPAIGVVSFDTLGTFWGLLGHALARGTLAILVVLVCFAHVWDQYVLIDPDSGVLRELSRDAPLDPAHIAVPTLVDGAKPCILHGMGVRGQLRVVGAPEPPFFRRVSATVSWLIDQ